MALGSGGAGGGNARGIRAGGAHVEIGIKDKFTASLKGIKNQLTRFGAGLAVGAGAGVAGVGSMVPVIQEMGKLNSAGKALGTTGAGISGLFGALGSLGGDFKEDLEGITQFVSVLDEAVQGKDGNAAKLFEGLSISAKDLMGLPIEEKFLKMHEAIRKLPQEQQAVRLGLIGGTDSMKKWIEVLALSNPELREMVDLHRMSQEDLDKATVANKAYQKATATVGRVWKQLAVAVAPAIEWIATKTSEWLAPLKNLGNWWDIQVARFKLGMAEMG
jgi:hypothetical protein